MSEMTKTPTHYRLLSTLKAMGPYLREGQCSELATISVAIRLREIGLQKRYQNLPKRRLIILKRNFTKS